MTYEEINEMMQEIGMPFAYHHFAEGESPKPPFVIFLSPGEDTFGADNVMYHSFKQLDVELYTDEKSPDAESRVEEVLTQHNIRQEFIFYKRAYDDVSQNALWQYMLEYFVKRYEYEAKEKLHTEVLNTQLKYSIRLYCYGCVGMTKEWLLNDNTTSAETVVQMMFASMPENMKEIYFTEE